MATIALLIAIPVDYLFHFILNNLSSAIDYVTLSIIDRLKALFKGINRR